MARQRHAQLLQRPAPLHPRGSSSASVRRGLAARLPILQRLPCQGITKRTRTFRTLTLGRTAGSLPISTCCAFTNPHARPAGWVPPPILWHQPPKETPSRSQADRVLCGPSQLRLPCRAAPTCCPRAHALPSTPTDAAHCSSGGEGRPQPRPTQPTHKHLAWLISLSAASLPETI